MPIRIDISPLI